MEQITFNPNNEPYYSEDFIKGFKCGAQRQFEADMADRRKEAPSIDIVRCGDCKHWSEKACHKFLATHPSSADDFCSYGERKESE